MTEQVIHLLKGLPGEWVVFIVASLPISELRGAIPLGIASPPFGFAIPWLKVYLLAVIGNIIPVVPLLLFLRPVSGWLGKCPVGKKFFNWLFERARRKGKIIQKYEAVGLALFVAIPLPVTGAWTGCVAAAVFGIRFKYALLAIIVGVMLAGAVMTLLTLSGRFLLHIVIT